MPSRLLRPGIGGHLAAIFVVLLGLSAYSLWVAENAFSRHVQFAQVVNETGRLRMLTQRMAYTAHQYVGDRPVARREMEQLAAEFEAGIRAVRERPRLVSATSEAALERLLAQWEVLRRTLEGFDRTAPRSEEFQDALRDVDLEADRQLTYAEAAVQGILSLHAEERRNLHGQLLGTMFLGIVATVIAYWRIRRRVVEPVRQIAVQANQFAAGDFDARIDYRAHDELGELVDVLNRTAGATQELFAKHLAAEQTLADSELRNRSLWETSADAIVMMTPDNVIRYANPAVQALFGYEPSELVGQSIEIIQPERLREAHRRGFARYLETRRRTVPWQSLENTALHRDGRELPVEISFSHMRLSDSDYFAAFFRDVSRRTEALAALRLRDRAMESTGDGILISDAVQADHPTIYVNPAITRITGYVPDEVVGRNARFFLRGDIDQPGVDALRHLLREQREGTVILRCYRKDGSLFWNELSVSPVKNEFGRVTHTISIFQDITDRKRQEDELVRNAHHDTLTGLANRTLMLDRLNQAITAAHRHNRQVGVLFVDLDNFKFINDSLGHDAGDFLLKEIAQRLGQCLREGDTVARLGGDEFVLLLTDMDQEEDIAVIAERVLAVTAEPVNFRDNEMYVGASIGASLYPRDGADSPTLLKHADIAMYRAKEHGRNNFQVFTEEMQARISRRQMLETHMRKALERDEFELYYQPQVSLETGRIVGAEALIRWRHPEMGLVSPAQFIPLAEETGLIVPIGEWVIDAACSQCKTWLEHGLPAPPIAVNLSARQFRQRNLIRIVEQSLRLHELDSLHIELELTESMVMQDPEQTIHTLRELKALGLRISLDDFGTGYSSLSYLRRFPLDVLKVDQSFVRDVTTSSDDAAITGSIISLAHSLQLQVIAEGVETAAQLDYLRAQRCDIVQGYYFSKPVPAPLFADLLTVDSLPRAAPGQLK